MTVRGLLLALALASASVPAAACHRFSVWHYPWAQPRCGVARQMVRLAVASRPGTVPNQEQAGNEAASPAIPLPSLAKADLDEPEADEPTRARLLLRAALEAANGPLQ